MNKPNIRSSSIFNGRVRVAITMKNYGPVHPKREDFADQLEPFFDLTGSRAMLFPRLAFTNQIVVDEPGREEDIDTFSGHDGEPIPGFIRSVAQTDAAMSGALPLAVCNADCPVGIILTTPNAQGQRQLVLMHLGLMSMISKTARTSLITETLNALRERDLRVAAFWMGLGAQPCCYGLGDNDDRWEIITSHDHRLRKVLKGPRKGQQAVDLGAIARAQLIEEGIDKDLIHLDDYCTCCSRRNPQDGEHFSNLMRHGAQARNLVVAWLT